MDKLITKYTKGDILFYRLGEKEYTAPSKLRIFVNFLHQNGLRNPAYSFVTAESTLIKSLSLKDNILLDSVPQTLDIKRETKLHYFIEQTGNKGLFELYNNIEDLHKTPENSSPESRKLTCLVKALLQQVNIMIFEQPERHLSQVNIEYFGQALNHETKGMKKTAIISSPSPIWNSVATKLLTRDQNGAFELFPIYNQQPLIHNEDNITFINFERRDDVDKKAA